MMRIFIDTVYTIEQYKWNPEIMWMSGFDHTPESYFRSMLILHSIAEVFIMYTVQMGDRATG